MTRDILRARWPQLTSRIRENWDRLTDEDVLRASGHRDYLVSKLQERYGMDRERAARRVCDFERSCSKSFR